jgi:hypothetical protein
MRSDKIKMIAAACFVLVVTCANAFAIDFSTPLHQLDGSEFLGQDGKPAPITLGDVCEVALLASYKDEGDDIVSGKIKIEDFNKEKARRFGLAKKIHTANGDLQVTTDDIALLKKLIGKSYNALIMGQAWELLDPASVK